MKDNTGNDFLNILIGEKLSSITFVIDYLQIDFDGNCFTLYVWPVVWVNNNEYKFEDPLYRDKLCSLITKVVSKINTVESEGLIIEFENSDRLDISLDPDNPELVTPEIAIFTDTNKKWYIFE